MITVTFRFKTPEDKMLLVRVMDKQNGHPAVVPASQALETFARNKGFDVRRCAYAVLAIDRDGAPPEPRFVLDVMDPATGEAVERVTI